MATTRHRSLVGRGRRKAFVRDKGLATKKSKHKKGGKFVEKTRYSRIQRKTFKHTEVPAKLLD